MSDWVAGAITIMLGIMLGIFLFLTWWRFRLWRAGDLPENDLITRHLLRDLRWDGNAGVFLNHYYDAKGVRDKFYEDLGDQWRCDEELPDWVIMDTAIRHGCDPVVALNDARARGF